MKLQTVPKFLLTCGLVAALTSPLEAQSDSSRKQNSDRQRQSQNDSDRQSSDRDQSKNRQRSQSRSGNQYRLAVDGWVHVAMDYDRDGYYDAVETIFVYDLKKAQQNSQARAKQQQQRSQSQQGRKMMQASGEIQSLQRKTTVDSPQQKVVAKLQTGDGKTATVCLGTQDKVNQLDLQKGDRIQVRGVRAKMNGKSMLLAHKVTAGDQTITNQLPKPQGLKRFSGEVVSTREAKFRGHDHMHLIAKVKTDQMGTREVNLGATDKFDDVEISDGTELKMLARKGKINDKSALIAQLVRVDGQSIDVREPTERSLKDRNDNRSARQSDRDRS